MLVFSVRFRKECVGVALTGTAEEKRRTYSGVYGLEGLNTRWSHDRVRGKMKVVSLKCNEMVRHLDDGRQKQQYVHCYFVTMWNAHTGYPEVTPFGLKKCLT